MAKDRKPGGRKPLTAKDYETKLAKSEAYEKILMDRLTRTLGRLKKASRRSSYLRRKITERTD